MKILSAAPHIRSRRTTKNIMLDVLIALLPATIAGIVYFGWQAAVIIVISLASAALTEFVWYIIEHKIWKNGQKTLKDFLAQFDFTSLVTGLLLALCLPANIEGWYMPLWEAFLPSALSKCFSEERERTSSTLPLQVESSCLFPLR